MFYLFVFLGLALGALTGILLGLPVLRLRGDYLAIVTLGFGEVIRVLANNLDKPLNLTNGPQGITPIQRPTLPAPLLDAIRVVLDPIVGRPVTDARVLQPVLLLCRPWWSSSSSSPSPAGWTTSKIGRAWTAIREDEVAAIAMGIPLVRMKLGAFAAGASFAGGDGCALRRQPHLRQPRVVLLHAVDRRALDGHPGRASAASRA